MIGNRILVFHRAGIIYYATFGRRKEGQGVVFVDKTVHVIRRRLKHSGSVVQFHRQLGTIGIIGVGHIPSVLEVHLLRLSQIVIRYAGDLLVLVCQQIAIVIIRIFGSNLDAVAKARWIGGGIINFV